MEKQVFGLIIGDRRLFQAHLCKTGREAMLAALKEEGIEAVTLGPEDTEHGSIKSQADAEKCAELFRSNRDRIQGVIISLPNFGDERAVAGALRMSDLHVPMLLQAFPDTLDGMGATVRADSFCGKISVCNALRQYGIPYSLTTQHTVHPSTEGFMCDLRWFAGVCRVVNGLRGLRVGAIGSRPAPFKTIRFSEKLFERSGISVETVDLGDVFGKAAKLRDYEPSVVAKVQELESYLPHGGVPAEAMVKMGKLGVVIESWMRENATQVAAIQCWRSMEEIYGIVPCCVMSMLTDRMVPAACELDVPSAIGMYALQLASGRPSAVVDWNNNYGDDQDKCVFYHCSALPCSLINAPYMDYHQRFAADLGKQNAYGAVKGRLKSSPFTYCRISTDDERGCITSYMGEGELTDDPLETFGGYGVARIPNLQSLMRYICEHGFEHHVAINPSHTSAIIQEAMGRYMGWEVYQHS